MEHTYKIRGGDGREYGPVNLDQLIRWIREGRALATQEIQRSDMSHWAAAREFIELQPTFDEIRAAAAPAAVSATPPSAPEGTDVVRLRSSASWFYWVAALSLVNSIVAVSGGNWRFIFGLGITQVFDGIGMNFESAGRIIALGLDLLTAGLLVLFGIFANKSQMWAFLVGGILLALDGVLMLIAQDWIGVAFHAFVVFRLFQGFALCRR